MQPWDIQNMDLNINRDWLSISIFIKSEPKRGGGGGPTIGKVCLTGYIVASSGELYVLLYVLYVAIIPRRLLLGRSCFTTPEH